MPAKQFEVVLDNDQRNYLSDLISSGVESARKLTRASFSLLRPPEGHARWTLRLLADKMVELEHFSSISHETIRQVLKKMNFDLG